MFLSLLIDELCTKKENNKAGCIFNFEHKCTRVQIVKKKKKKKRNTPINFNTNYRREMKLIPINVDYFLL